MTTKHRASMRQAERVQSFAKRQPKTVPAPHVMPGITREMLMSGRARPARLRPVEVVT